MNGKEMVKIIDSILAERGMTQKEFCEAIGIQSSSMSGWRKGSTPTPQRVAAIEKCLGISFADYEKSDMDDETADLLQSIRERQDLRILLHSAKDVPASSIYALISQIERMKEDES
jgi:transcriptional regulator with XRE-family HTH domain